MDNLIFSTNVVFGEYPSIEKIKNEIRISTKINFCIIDTMTEAILYTVTKYGFIPYWLVERFLTNENYLGYDSNYSINNLISVGLLDLNQTDIGVFLTATGLLYKIFNTEFAKTIKIPYNTLINIVNEEYLMIRLLTENNVVSIDFNVFPKYSPLGLNYESGNNIISSREMKTPQSYCQESKDYVKKIYEAGLATVNKNGLTDEMRDLNKFTIIHKEEDTFSFHRPSLAIPCIRNGKPNSISILIEISKKTYDYYEKLIDVYNNNFIYGSLYIMCGNNNIMKAIRTACEDKEINFNLKIYEYNFNCN